MRQILIMAILLVQAFAASAQSNIEKVFKIVLNNPSTEVLSSSDYNVVCVDSGVSYCKFTEFTVPVKKKKLFAQIEKELLLAKSDAYNVYIKKPGTSSFASNRLYDYGANNEYSVELGARNSHIYYGLCFKDPADSMRRHAYLAVWFKDSRKYHCYYYHIYGVMPARFNEFKSGVRGALKPINKGSMLRTQTVLDDNGVTTTTYDNDGNVYIKKPGTSSFASNRLYDYGANNEYSVELGARNSHIYYGLCFKDPADSMRRHAYLAVWFKDSRKYHCYYYHIYGVMPARFNEFKSGVRGALKPINKGSMLRTQTVLDDNGVTTTTYDNDGNVRVFNSRSFSSAMANEVKTDIDFMLLFGNLRAAFLDAIKDADAKTLQTGIVVKIARLCREHSKLLTDNEKRTCISIIDEMKSTLKKVNPDTFMDGVLQEARLTMTK